MENEIKDVQTMEVLAEGEVIPFPEPPSMKPFVIGSLIAGVVAIGATILHKTKAKREAKLVERLRKKGYTIIEPLDCDLDEQIEEQPDKEV